MGAPSYRAAANAALITLAASLLATAPILVIPLAVRFGGEKVGWSALLGTLFAVLGVVILVGPGAVDEP